MKNKNYYVSVIVCAYNEEKLIESCLVGLVAQSYDKNSYEIIVIDDESTDNTFEIVQNFISGLNNESVNLRLVRIKHGGLSVARNSGIELSKGDIIAFIDGDAIPDKHWLEQITIPFHDNADYVGGRIDLLNTDSKVAKFQQQTKHKQFFGPKVYQDQFIGCNMAFHKRVFDEYIGFYENFVSRGDETTFREKIESKCKFKAAPNAVVYHERPDNIKDLIKVIWVSSKLSYLCSKSSSKVVNWKIGLNLVEKALVALLPIFIILLNFKFSVFFYLTLLSSIAILRQFYVRRINALILKGLINEYGYIMGLLSHFLYYWISNTVYILGYIISPFYHFRTQIIPPKTTKLHIVSSYGNYEENINKDYLEVNMLD